MRRPLPSAPAGPLAEAMDLHRRGHLGPARRVYREALARKPDDADALELYGQLLGELSDFAEAARILTKAAELNPNSLNAQFNLAATWKALNKASESEACYRRAIALEPKLAAAHVGLSDVLIQQGRFEDALAAADGALALDPSNMPAILDAGLALTRLGRHAEAEARFRAAVEREPNAIDALVEWGRSLATIGQREKALDALRRALSRDPASPVLQRRVAAALRDLGRQSEAIAAFQAIADREKGATDVDLELIKLKREAADWSGLARIERRVLSAVRKSLDPIDATCLLAVDDEPKMHARVGRLYPHVPEVPSTFPAFTASAPGAKIRVGYFAANFHDQAAARAIAQITPHHDRSRFEIHGFALRPAPAAATTHLPQQTFDGFHDLGLSSTADAVTQIRAIGLDVAIDLGGLSKEAWPALFASRIAPVQATMLGYPATTELAQMDYAINSRFAFPEGADSDYSERIVRLPRSPWPITPVDAASPRPDRKSLGLPETGFVFMAFDLGMALTSQLYDHWMRILAAVPGSILWFDTGETGTQEHLRQEAAGRGIDPARICFAPPLSDGMQALAGQSHADLALDTFPLSRPAAAAAALSMGVPVLTIGGRSAASRGVAALLHDLSAPDLVARDLAAYEALAVRLATEPATHQAMVDRLTTSCRTNPLIHTKALVRHLESAFVQMVTRARAGETPTALTLTDTTP